jgi:hypothetical protein
LHYLYTSLSLEAKPIGEIGAMNQPTHIFSHHPRRIKNQSLTCNPTRNQKQESFHLKGIISLPSITVVSMRIKEYSL